MNKLIITFLVYTFGLSKLLAEPPKLHFIENKGQWSEEFIFKKSLGNGQVYFEKNKLSFFLADFGSLSHPPHNGDAHYKPEHVNVDGPANYDYYSFTFLGSEEPECVEGKGRRLTKVNYLRGNKPDNWFGNVATYESVLYGDIYSGIDAVFSQYNNYLKYDFYVAPNSCPEQIMLGYENVGNMHINEGRLIVNTEVGYVQELKPYAYQIIEGEIIAIPCEYVLKDNMVHFQFPEGYETNVELVIDPILIFSTYSGSTYDNWGNTATFDSLGNLYSGGMVTTARGMDFPITSGAYQETFGGGTWDAAILKYDSAGQELLYATYLGGAGNEIPQSLVVDSEGDLLILGTTSSVDFPITNGSTFKGGTSIEPIGGVDFNGTDIFVTKLSEDGSELLASTYLGGTGNDGVNFISGKLNDPDTDKEESPLARNYGDQLRGDVFTDSKNDVYIASNTLSSDFLIADNILNTFQGGSLDAALVKLSGDLSVLWSRFIGGSGADAAYSIKVNSVDEVVISGGTNSNDISDMNTGWQNSNAGNIDGWIKKFSSDGSVLIEGTYLGTAAYDQSYFIDIDSEDNIYTFGQTQGVFPITGSVYTEVNGGQFLQKYSSDLTQLLLSTTFGSGGNTPDISPTAFLVNECNNIYFAGWGGATNIARISSSVSRNFVGGDTFGLRTSEDAIDRITSGNDFYLMVLSGDAQDFLYGTFFGGEASNTHVDGGTSRFDKNGIVYHSVCAGCGGLESDFPATPGAYSEINNSSNCNNAAFKFDLASLRARFNTNSITFDNPGISSICLGDVFILENQSIGGELFEWDFDDGSPIISRTDTTFIQHIYQNEGIYTIQLKASDRNTCIAEDFAFKTVQVFDPPFFVMDDATICAGESIPLFASGALSYTWVNSDGTFFSNEASPVVEPIVDTRYLVSLDFAQCSKIDTVNVDVIPQLIADFNTNTIDFNNPGASIFCLGDTVIFENNSIEGMRFEWYFGDSSPILERTDTSHVLYSYQSAGIYEVRLTAFDTNTCTAEEFDVKTVQIIEPNVFIMDDQTICFGDELRLQASGAQSYEWVSEDGVFSSNERTPLVKPELDTRYFITLASGGCVKKDTVDIRVVPEIVVDFSLNRTYDCWSSPVIEVVNNSPVQDTTFTWSFGDGTFSNEDSFIHSYDQDGIYTVSLSVPREFCVFEKNLQVDITTIRVPNIITPTVEGDNDTFIIEAPDRVVLRIYNEWGGLVLEDEDYQNTWAGADVSAGVYYYEAQIENEATCKGWVQVLK